MSPSRTHSSPKSKARARAVAASGGIVVLAISIAVLGSLLAGVFTSHMPANAPAAGRDSIGAAFQLGLEGPAKSAFTAAMSTGSWISAGFALAAAALGLICNRVSAPSLPAHPPARQAPAA